MLSDRSCCRCGRSTGVDVGNGNGGREGDRGELLLHLSGATRTLDMITEDKCHLDVAKSGECATGSRLRGSCDTPDVHKVARNMMCDDGGSSCIVDPILLDSAGTRSPALELGLLTRLDSDGLALEELEVVIHEVDVCDLECRVVHTDVACVGCPLVLVLVPLIEIGTQTGGGGEARVREHREQLLAAEGVQL